MKLFLISQNENEAWDTYDAAVVCAPDAKTAANMNPQTGQPMNWLSTERPEWCSGPQKVEVRYLGEACDDIAPGIICASYGGG